MDKYGATDYDNLPQIDYTYAHNKFYVFENFNLDSFGVLKRLDPGRNKAVIDFFKERLNNGSVGDIQDYRRAYEHFRDKRGGRYSSTIDVGNRGTSGNNVKPDGRTGESPDRASANSDGGRDNRADLNKSKRRYSPRTTADTDDYKFYNGTAILKTETVDKWLHDYASDKSPNYAQAYITYMSPDQFLRLTTDGIGDRAMVEIESKKFNLEEFRKATEAQPLQMYIDTETGKVEGHEGRHRNVALSRSGVHAVPVLLFDSNNKYSKTDISEMTLKGQFNKYESATIQNAIPLSYANRDRIISAFATQSSQQRI